MSGEKGRGASGDDVGLFRGGGVEWPGEVADNVRLCVSGGQAFVWHS